MIIRLEYITLVLLTLALILASMQFAHADEDRYGDNYKRPYGNSVDTDYQNNYHNRQRAGKESLFQQDLKEDGDIGYQKRKNFIDNQSYMLPPNKKTIPVYGPR